MKRLLESSLPPRAAALLRSAATDVPPRAAEEKARLASVVAAGAMATDFGRRVSSGKWLGLLSLVVIGAGAVVGTGYRLSPSSSAPQVATTEKPAQVSAPSLPAESPGRALAPAATEAPSVSVTDLPTAAGPIASARTVKPHVPTTGEERPAAAARSSSSDSASLEDELKALDEARAAFVGRQPALALERVESYRRRFPAGHFKDETDALEIQALAALDRADEARSKATRFLSDRPESPYAQRVRSAVGLEK